MPVYTPWCLLLKEGKNIAKNSEWHSMEEMKWCVWDGDHAQAQLGILLWLVRPCRVRVRALSGEIFLGFFIWHSNWRGAQAHPSRTTLKPALAEAPCHHRGSKLSRATCRCGNQACLFVLLMNVLIKPETSWSHMIFLSPERDLDITSFCWKEN